MADQRQRPVRRVAERDQVSAEPVAGEAEQAARQVLVLDGGVSAADGVCLVVDMPGRMVRVQHEPMFLANYADVLTDAPLDVMISRFRASDAVGGLLAVPPQSAFHCVNLGEGDLIGSITTLTELPLWENGGYLCHLWGTAQR